MEVIKPSPVEEPLKIENAGGDGADELSISQKKRLKKKRKLMTKSSVHEPLKMENAGDDGAVKLSRSEKNRLKEELNVIKPSPVHEPLKMENSGGDGAVKLSKSEKKRLKEELNVIKQPPVHEPLKVENAGGNSFVNLSTSEKKRLKEKLNVIKPSPVHELLKMKNAGGNGAVKLSKSQKKSLKNKLKEKDTNGKMVLWKSKNHNKDGTRKKKEMHRSTDRRPTLGEILNPQYLELWGPRYAKIARKSQNKKKQQVANATINLEREKNQVKKVEMTRTMEPIIDEILTPRNLEEQEIVEANSESPKEMSNKRKREEIQVQPTDLTTHEKSKVKASDDDITHGAKLEKKLLVFDINGLFADIVSPHPQNIIADKYIPRRAIFKRPFLDDFLRFCFEKFTVGIWSSRTKQVLDPVVDFLFGDLKKNLLFIWNNSNCTNTGMKTLEDRHKPIVLKDLNKIWSKNGPGNSWVKGTFHESNTLLLDDSPYKALLNPKYTGIFPESYSYQNRNDDFLGPNGALRMYLEGLADSDNVKTYVEQHPFGQRAIDQKHQHWNFYSKVLKGQK